jgi:hypothetical protein
MTDRFRTIAPDAAAVTKWGTDLDQWCGQLGNAVRSEIVDHDQPASRSVYLYYHGTKLSVKIWVTFAETDIAGLHWARWTEGNEERKLTKKKEEEKREKASVVRSMDVAEFIVWGCILIPMIVMSLFLLSGKGAFLIAGYNTMSKTEQAKYDKKALCRCTGGFLLTMTFVLLLVPIGIHMNMIWLSLCVIPMISFGGVGFLIYANTGNRFHKKGDVETFVAEENEEEKALNAKKEAKQEKMQLWFLGFVAVVIPVAIMIAIPGLFLLGEREPTVEIIDSGIKIGGMYGLKIDFAEIADISLMENSIGAIGLTLRTNGYGTPSTQKGHFESNKYGSVLLFTKTKASPTIHIERKGKEDVFLNFSDNEATKTLYSNMKTALAR